MPEKYNIDLEVSKIPLNLNISKKDEDFIKKAAQEINEHIFIHELEKGAPPEPFYFLAYVALINTIKMMKVTQKLNEIESNNNQNNKCCQYCGIKSPTNFCPNCGKQLKTNEDLDSEKQY